MQKSIIKAVSRAVFSRIEFCLRILYALNINKIPAAAEKNLAVKVEIPNKKNMNALKYRGSHPHKIQ